MTFILRRSSPYVFALIPTNFFNDPDKPVVKTYINPNPENESGMYRIKRMLSLNEYGEFSPEIRYCIHVSSMGLILGGIYGGIIRGRSAFINFIDNNEGTMFRNHLDAKRKLQDAVTLSFAKGVGQWSWRTCFFTSIYTFTTTFISVFRGKSGIIEHMDAGFIAGAIYNMKNGIRGVIVGGGLGSVLGTIFGCIFYGILVLSGQTMEEVRFWTYEWKQNRNQLIADGERKRRLKKDEEDIIKITTELTKKETEKLVNNK